MSGIGLAVLTLLLPVAQGEQSTVEIKRWTVACGGGVSYGTPDANGDRVRLRGTIGQPVGGPVTTGGYSLFSGFWVPGLVPPPPGNIVWDANDVSTDRTTRSLRFRVEGKTDPPLEDAIRAEMFELQHPNPRNAHGGGVFLPGDFSKFDTLMNGVCAGAVQSPNYNGYPCNTVADCADGDAAHSGTSCSNLAACTGDPVCTDSATCTLPSNSCARWVGKPGTFLEAQDNQGLGNYRAARLQCTPFYYDWAAETATQPITVVGAEILPSSAYLVQTYGSSCKGSEGLCANVGQPKLMLTRRHGDLASKFNPPDGSVQPDAADVSKVVDSFKKLSSGLVKAISKITPNLPEENNDVDSNDISSVVDAVKGYAYKLGGPCPCPSAAICGALTCSTDAVCIGALGPEAKCIKTCTGGPNNSEPCLTNRHCGNTCLTGPKAGQWCDDSSGCAGYACTIVGTCGTPLCRDRCGRCTP